MFAPTVETKRSRNEEGGKARRKKSDKNREINGERHCFGAGWASKWSGKVHTGLRK